MTRTFKCSDCGKEYREGINVETDMNLYSAEMTKRCVYCYNKKTHHSVNPEWLVAVADRLEYEGEIEELVDLHLKNSPKHDFYTSANYKLFISFETVWPLVNWPRVEEARTTLQNIGFECGELDRNFSDTKAFFSVDFKAPFQKTFKR